MLVGLLDCRTARLIEMPQQGAPGVEIASTSWARMSPGLTRRLWERLECKARNVACIVKSAQRNHASVGAEEVGNKCVKPPA